MKIMYSGLSHLIAFLLCSLLISVFPAKGCSQLEDPFLVSVYDQLHWSPKQAVFQKLHPMPAGVVYIQHPGEGAEEMRWHFRTMKELGFNSLKQIVVAEDWTIEDILLLL